jgi:hypothetical protein
MPFSHLFHKVKKTPWKKPVESTSYLFTRWLFLRLLGIIYFIAFISLWTQVTGLIGSQGILPAYLFLQEVKKQIGLSGYWFFPTLAWLNGSDAFLRFLCLGGAIFSIFIILGILTVPALVLCWMFYLSLVTVGQDFLSFQWDILLLETGFLAIFFAPLQILPDFSRESPPPLIVLWLLRWLLFRLMFSSGVVKLASGDPTWRNLTALQYHYETQPLPTPTAWYMHQLPAWFQKISVMVMFIIELIVPFLIFASRRLRLIGAGLLAFLQVCILMTGNYAFFNLLTLTLCLLLLDDTFLGRFLPRRVMGPSIVPSVPTINTTDPPGRTVKNSSVKDFLRVILAVGILFISGLQMIGLFLPRGNLPEPVAEILMEVAPLRLVNPYGLFAVMTTSRPEIIVEGSQDGKRWFPYEFKYKPGDVKRAPLWVAPHQPRLDWQMWFAALGSYTHNPWFINFMAQLLRGSPDVLALLDKNPFPDAPPRYVRAALYNYHFTNFTTRRTEGTWWHREWEGWYLPEVTLRSP